jgi:hypothetical protein
MPNRTSYTVSNQVGGELSAFMSGRTDLDVLRKSSEWCQNFLPMLEGGASFRTGFEMVGLTANNGDGALIPFQFSVNDAYMIVATNGKFRFYRNNGVVLSAAVNISGITQANPGVVTATAHGYSNGDEVFIASVAGMTQVNRRFFKVANKTTNTFELQDQFGNNVSTASYTAYGSGGTVSKIFEVATTYTSGYGDLRYIQTADTMYIGSNAYEPRKLVRSGHTSWTFGTYARVSDPFSTSAKWPACFSFTIDGRLSAANLPEAPEKWVASRANNATYGYDDFTASGIAIDSIALLLAPVANTMDVIQEMVQYNKQIVLLGASSIRRLYGETPDLPPNALKANNAEPTFEGAARVRPLVIGGALIYVDVSGKQLKELRFDQYQESYEAKNLSLLATHLSESNIVRIVRVKGDLETIWALRADGLLLSFAYSNRENAAGWARHPAANGGIIEDIATLRNSSGEDQLWMIVKRTLNGVVYRSVEVRSAIPQWADLRKFYSGNKAADKVKLNNVNWETQKSANHLDMAVRYDGRSRGSDASATVTPSAVTGSSITITASASVFTASDVGAQIRKRYATDGSGGGIAEITGYTSGTQVTCKVLADFDGTAAIAAGSWEITATTLNNLHLYSGLSVDVVADGSYVGSKAVTNGALTLDSPAAQIFVGFKYTGLIATQNVDTGGTIGPAHSKMRSIAKARLRFKDTVGCKVGTSEYQVTDVLFREPGHIAGRIHPPFRGVKEVPMLDSWEYEKKQIVVVHDTPYPCTLLAIDMEVDTVDHT